MPYFHVTAAFEARGPSMEEADQQAAALFAAFRHPRVHYYEHHTSGGLGPYPPAKSLYFTTVADFDVEAYTEEKAGETADEALDALSTEAVQYVGHGIVAGAQRAQAKPQAQREGERQPRVAAAEEREGREEREERGGREEREERGGRGRRPRSRRRGRVTDHEAETAHEESETRVVTEERVTVERETPVQAPAAPEERVPPPARAARKEEAPIHAVAVEESRPVPPPRSSASMRVTLTVSLRASELTGERGETGLASGEGLVALAVAEARRRHPELPSGGTPESAISSLPGGDRLVVLTWHYDAPVPSAAETEAA